MHDCLLSNATLSGDRAPSIAPCKPVCTRSFSGNRATTAKLLPGRRGWEGNELGFNSHICCELRTLRSDFISSQDSHTSPGHLGFMYLEHFRVRRTSTTSITHWILFWTALCNKRPTQYRDTTHIHTHVEEHYMLTIHGTQYTDTTYIPHQPKQRETPHTYYAYDPAHKCLTHSYDTQRKTLHT